MTAGLRRGVELFNNGRYWDAHEVWEHEWMPDRKGPEGGFYKGLIQVAAGCLHYSRGNRRGAVNKWRSGADYLRPYLPAHRGIRLEPLVTPSPNSSQPNSSLEYKIQSSARRLRCSMQTDAA